MTDYALEGPKWGARTAGTAGGLVAWAMDASVPAWFTSVLTTAFADWSAQADIGFAQVAPEAAHQITFSLGAIDGLNKVLAQTNYRYANGLFTAAAITFDTGEGWHLSGTKAVSTGNLDLFVVALHEIGHALGLDHYNAAPAAMNATLNRSVADLTASDIDGIRALYGPAATTQQAAATSGAAGATAGVVASPDTLALFGTVEHDPASPAAGVYALYEGLLGRAPDPLGLEGFATALQTGASLVDVAGALLASPEHAGRASDPARYVTDLYAGILHRSPDAAGLTFFTDELGQGVSRAQVAVQLATSAEARAHLAAALPSGLFVPDAIDAGVARLYYGVLGRAPDAAGLRSFEAQVHQAAAGGGVDGAIQALARVASAMLGSSEYAAGHPDTSDAGFVDGLYMGALGRHADAAGAAYWADQLAHGLTRSVAALAIAESGEAQVRLVGQIEQGHLLYGA